MNYSDLFIVLIPEAAVTIAALVILGLDLGMMRQRSVGRRMAMGAFLTTLGCLAAASWILSYDQSHAPFDGVLVINGLNGAVKLVILALTVLTAWLAVPYRFTRHVGEFYVLLLLATVGMMFLVSTEHMLMIFVSLELLSLCLYIMTALNKERIQSAEAALKYFLFGGMSAAFMLFGLSLVYGLTGQLNLGEVATALAGRPLEPMLSVALIMIVIGFGFKVAAVPFHLWAPDAYEGAPIPCAAFIASGSKVASFFILAKVLMVGFASMPLAGAGSGEPEGAAASVAFAGWVPVLAGVAALSLVVGNLAAIVQNSVRRLLAYSAVAQAGYILVGMVGATEEAMTSVLYYTATYAVTTLGAFAVVGHVQQQTGREDMAAFAGLGRRSPLVSFCLLIFLLSLAGIPPLAGFFGKFYLFVAALKGGGGSMGLLWLVILAVGMSAVSLYYYLQVLKQVYVREGDPDAAPLETGFGFKALLALIALLVVGLGCAPNLLLGPFLPLVQSWMKAAGL